MDRRRVEVRGHHLQTLHLRKEYPGTVALNGVSVDFEGGRVHALIGKNGAGKSTLVKIFAGSVQPTSGTILIDGAPVELRSPSDAFAKGIATVYQEMSLVPEMTVAENIFLGRWPRRKGLLRSMVDWRVIADAARQVLDGMHVSLDLRRNVSELGMAQQQIVEIAKAMSFNPSVIMLDEPTSALARHETENLFALIRQLAAKGVAVIHITHRLQELGQVADTVTVLRDGNCVGTIGVGEATPETIAHMMFGGVTQAVRPADLQAGTEAVMKVRGLGQPGKFHDVNFELRKGEVLGIAGMLGSGRTELLRAIFGVDPCETGEVVLDGNAIRPSTPAAMKGLGLAFTPENRKEHGLVQELSTRANVCLASLDRISTAGFMTALRERAVVLPLMDRLAVKVPDIEHAVASLSGGNQQKVVVAKWLNTTPRVILFDEPTRGIDVQAKQQIFRIMWDLSRQGISCIFVSSELEELVEVCHRILIMKHGTMVGEVFPESLSVEELVVRCMDA
jgi:ribose transport system ATP-binding protein